MLAVAFNSFTQTIADYVKDADSPYIVDLWQWNTCIAAGNLLQVPNHVFDEHNEEEEDADTLVTETFDTHNQKRNKSIAPHTQGDCHVPKRGTAKPKAVPNTVLFALAAKASKGARVKA